MMRTQTETDAARYGQDLRQQAFAAGTSAWCAGACGAEVRLADRPSGMCARCEGEGRTPPAQVQAPEAYEVLSVDDAAPVDECGIAHAARDAAVEIEHWYPASRGRTQLLDALKALAFHADPRGIETLEDADRRDRRRKVAGALRLDFGRIPDAKPPAALFGIVVAAPSGNRVAPMFNWSMAAAWERDARRG